ncbi:hypothetical protein [Anabaena sp. UHCC 0399]|uniref:hypothetical protein n=1 Tax=Anabaena sp. UHCC 0399 TaxID=3110238 RepID=UPI002B1FB6E7|nr:hypothetical protein [Anabaena sp. UHCC 0399]MEA5568609.1 hypothetical protein [Anabaena sp. UHCC 0399]
MDKRKLKRYELAVYCLLLALSIILSFIGDQIPQETIKSITINLASEMLAVGILFFLINRIFLLGDDSGLPNKILDEIRTIQSSLHKEEQEKKRQEQKISVILQSGARQRLELPVELRRAELTRAEILGRIGMIPMKVNGQRFSLDYLNTPDFLRQINRILASDGDATLMIPCNDSEYAQFDLDRINY